MGCMLGAVLNGFILQPYLQRVNRNDQYLVFLDYAAHDSPNYMFYVRLFHSFPAVYFF